MNRFYPTVVVDPPQPVDSDESLSGIDWLGPGDPWPMDSDVPS